MVRDVFLFSVDEDALSLELAEEDHDGQDERRDQEWEVHHSQVVGLVEAHAVASSPPLWARATARVIVKEELVTAAQALSHVGHIASVTAGEATNASLSLVVVGILKWAISVARVVEEVLAALTAIAKHADAWGTLTSLAWWLAELADTSN